MGECLESILSQSRLPDEIVVLDNASTDGSRELLEAFLPKITVIPLDENIGFAAACNRGIQETSSELVAILNNDIILELRWLESLLTQVKPDWSSWASRIVFAADPDRIDSAGDGMAVVGAAYKIGHGDPAVAHATSREVFGPCAAAALYRRSLLEDLDGFDEDFFLIYEDADLNMRARLMGYRCLYVPEAIVRHRVNQSIGTFSHTYVYYGHRNSECLFWKNMPTRLLCRYLPERMLFNSLSFIYFSSKRRGLSFLKSKVDFLRDFSSTLKKRQRIQNRRKLSHEQLRTLLDRNWFRYRKKVAIQS